MVSFPAAQSSCPVLDRVVAESMRFRSRLPGLRRCSPFGRLNGQFQSEHGTVTRTVAVDAQRAAHLLGRQRATVQAETVSVFPCGEPMIEDAGKIFRWNSNTIVHDRDAYPVVA